MRPPRMLALSLSLLLLACEDRKEPAAPVVDLVSTVPAGELQVVVQQMPSVQAGTQVFAVRVVGNELAVGAYQGELSFTPGAFELVSVETPQGVEGAHHVVNAAEFAAGKIRFAAFATESFADNVAFRFTVRGTTSAIAARLVGTLEVAGEANGTAIANGRLRASSGITR